MHNDIIKKYYEDNAINYNNKFFEAPSSYPTLLYRQEHILAHIRDLKLPLTSVILDAGCGTGDMVKELAQIGYTVYGSDIATEMVNIATLKNDNHIKSGKVFIQQADVENLPYNDLTFDVVILSGVIEYLKNDELWLKQVKRVLKPNGYLILNVTNKNAVRRWTQPIFEPLKTNSYIRSAASFIKEKIFHKGRLDFFNFKIRLHEPKKFDAWLLSNGFIKKDQSYFDYCLLPYPLDILVPVSYKKRKEQNARKDSFYSGCGYIVVASKAK